MPAGLGQLREVFDRETLDEIFIRCEKSMPDIRRCGSGMVESQYRETVSIIERLQRCLHDVVRGDLDIKEEVSEESRVSPEQALLLYNIGDREITAVKLIAMGYCFGSQVSLNVKRLVERGYLYYARSSIDRRAVRLKLSEKGRSIHKMVASLFDRHIATVEQIGGISAAELWQLNQSLMRIERFWTDQIKHRLLATDP